MRADASLDADKVTKVRNGEEVSIISEQDTGWTTVEYDGKVGYGFEISFSPLKRLFIALVEG